ncbi:MAG: PH domain-containing protein [Dehalogenimonas sp.]|uniref:PH domain-containing protein n=1 Tax=Candidatus Dehalogenimonas loeffleri TaxID=3127115 RepID=A0ABZ2J1E0_9CHLR|nr:PH domain-containing protein [Dehalogenimonas sp.]
MMRYPSGKSTGFSVLLWGVVAILSVSVVISPSEMRAFIVPASLLGIALILWVWFGTYYEFHDRYLLARMGPFFERIPYGRITSAKPFKSLASSMALSSDMIEIRHGKHYFSGTTYISPANRESFLAELKSRCPNLQN